MREIKFRGKRIDNGEWVVGSLLTLWITDVKPSENDAIEDREFEDVKANFIVQEVHTDYEFDDEYRHQVDPETVGQYTEQKDVNDQELYDGDIVQFAIFDYNGSDTQHKGVIKFSDGQWQIWAKNDADEKYFGADGPFVLYAVWYNDDGFEKLGNIYEHPHSLGETDQ